MKQELVVNQVRRFINFSYLNKPCGTGHVENCPILARIIKRWDDKETGERCWAIPVVAPENEEALKFLVENATVGISTSDVPFSDFMDYGGQVGNQFVIFCGEFDLIKEDSEPKPEAFKTGIDVVITGKDFHVETEGEVIKYHMEGNVKVIDEFKITSINIVSTSLKK